MDEVPSPRRPAQGLNPPLLDLDQHSILSRLDAIEKLLGIKAQPEKESLDDDVSLHPNDSESPFRGVWSAASHLQASARSPQNPRIWSRAALAELWLGKCYLNVFNAVSEWTGRLWQWS